METQDLIIDSETSQLVANNEQSTKLVGGCTGKGFMPGVSGNPSGRPKRDIAAEIAEIVFLSDPKRIEKALKKQLLKGDSKMFTALADRAFGKVAQPVDVEHSGGVNLIHSISRPQR